MSRRIHRRALTAAAVAVLTLGALGASAADHSATPSIAYGSPLALGAGSARTYVELDDAGVPVAFGVAIAEAALATDPAAGAIMLPVPTSARWAGYDHVLLDWQPRGDEPGHARYQPHVDFRFYTSADVQGAQYQPVAYASLPDGMPATAAEHADTGMVEMDGRRFARTFVYGAFDGQFVAFEPTIARATFDDARVGGRATEILTVAGPHAPSGRYVTSYEVAFDARAREYRVRLHTLRAP
jgi:hypothetical protein